MRTEYDFTTAQKAELKRIEDEIKQLNRKIFDLLMERELIHMGAPCQYIFDDEEYVSSIKKMIGVGLFDKPLIPTEGIVKMIFEDKKEEQNV